MKTNKKLPLLTITLSLLLPLLQQTAAYAWPDPDPSSTRASRAVSESDLYAEGTDAIDDEDWTRAINVFKKVVALNGSRADAALYWKAYAEDKAGRGGDALQTVATLERKYPKSRWVRDARALSMNIKQSTGQRVDPGKVDDEELKIIAIQGLLSADPNRALPLLQKIIEGPYSEGAKEKALFVLSQSPLPEAAKLISAVARGNAHPELQSEAIKYLGLSGAANVGLLSDVYRTTTNPDVKEDILKAFMLAGARDQLLAAAKSEKNADVREEAIRQLGVLGARRELQEMYRSESSRDLKETIIQGLFVAGDKDAVMNIARTETDPDLRATAVKHLGLLGRDTGPMLVSIYQGTNDEDVRDAAVSGLFVQGNAHALIELARAEKSPDRKRSIVSKLSLMKNKEAVEYMDSLLK